MLFTMNENVFDLRWLDGEVDAPWLDDMAFHKFMSEMSPAASRGKYFIDTAVRLVKRWERRGSVEDLNRAIELLEQALLAIDVYTDEYAWCLDCLDKALTRRYGITKSIDDINRIIDLNETAAVSVTAGHVHYPTYIYNLSIGLKSRFEEAESMDDLDRTITTAQRAVEFIPHDVEASGQLDSSSNMTQAGLEILSSRISIDQASDMLIQSGSPQVRPTREEALIHLSTILRTRFEMARSMDDINRSIAAAEEAVARLPHDHHNRVRYLFIYAAVLGHRFDRTGAIEDLNLIIGCREQAAALQDSVDYLNLSILGFVLLKRYERMGSMEDLRQAIAKIEQALEFSPKDDPDRGVCLGYLGMALNSRFESNGSANDIEQAVKVMEQALDLIPKGHPSRPGILNDFSIVLRGRGARTGSMKDVSRSITIAKEALQSVTTDNPRRPLFLITTANALAERFVRTGSADDLDRAIEVSEEAVQEDFPELANGLTNLGNALEQRYQRTGSMEDLDRAIEVKERGASIISKNDPKRGIFLNNWALALRTRFGRQPSIKDLLTSLIITDQAIKCTPPDNPHRAKCFNSLGMLFEVLFDLTARVNHLERSIAMYKKAMSSTSSDHPDRGTILSNLGAALWTHFEQTKSIDDLNYSIATIDEALTVRPKDDPGSVISLTHLARALASRFEQHGSEADSDRAMTTVEQAVAITTAPPSVRLRVVTTLLPFLIRQDKHRAMSIFRSAIQIFPTISPRSLNRSDQQHNIAEFTEITPHAVSLYLECGETPFTALQLSELGKGVLANLQLEIRSDISLLAESHPEHAKQFNEIRDQLDSPHLADRSTRDQRRTLSKRFETLLTKIRKLDGFENFLLGPSESILKALAGRDSIVVFNVSEIRSDAFLINAHEIRSIQLPLQSEDLVTFTNRFLNAIHDYGILNYRNAIREMNAVLGWLWDEVVGPILGELGFTETPGPTDSWPRVWWVGSGLLNALPIHAAGYHDSVAPVSAIDRVISSYSPTVKSLAYAQERATRVGNVDGQNALLIGMPTTLDKKDLPFVKKEIEELQKLLSATIETTVLQNPTREKALSALLNHQIVHLSCHGLSAFDPSQSSLLLDDWKTASLTVSDLTSSNIQSAAFAYLSACHTSATRDSKLLDESINLSSAIQLAGYPSVVGSLWQINDIHSVQVAKDVYTWMLNGGNRLEIPRSAEGLHRAQRALRDRTRTTKTAGRNVPHDPLVWAPYIHIGI